MAVKRGDLVRVNREKLDQSVEALASDRRWPPYLFSGQGEVVELRGDYAQVKFSQVPTPNVWLRIDQLEAAQS